MASTKHKPDFPTTDDVEKASHEQLAYWYRFLMADTPEHKKIMDRVAARFKEKGGMTPALSEKIGYGGA